MVVNSANAFFDHIYNSSIDTLVTKGSFHPIIMFGRFKEIELLNEEVSNARYSGIFDFDIYKVGDRIVDFSEDDLEVFVDTNSKIKIDNYHHINLNVQNRTNHPISSLKLTNLNSEVLDSNNNLKNIDDYFENGDTLSIFYYDHNQEKVELFRFNISVD